MAVVTVPFQRKNDEATTVTITPGEYRIRLERASDTVTAKGDPMVYLYFRVVDDGPFKGASFRQNHVLTEAASWSFQNFLEASGFGLFEKRTTIDLGKLAGLVCQAKLVNEMFNGYTNTRVARYYPAADTVAAQFGGTVEDCIDL